MHVRLSPVGDGYLQFEIPVIFFRVYVFNPNWPPALSGPTTLDLSKEEIQRVLSEVSFNLLIPPDPMVDVKVSAISDRDGYMEIPNPTAGLSVQVFFAPVDMEVLWGASWPPFHKYEQRREMVLRVPQNIVRSWFHARLALTLDMIQALS